MIKTAPIWLAVAAPFALATLAAADDVLNDDNTHIEEIPLDVYQAAILGSANEAALLPSLDYWGIGSAAWGMPTSSDAVAAAMSPTVESCTIGGQSCTVSHIVRGTALIGVRYDFAAGVEDRTTRLERYRALRAALTSEYGTPSDTGNDEDTLRGEDAYVQGLDALYSVDWIGNGTNVSLVLTDELLFIELGATPGVENTSRAADWQAFTEIRDTLPSAHPLNRIIAQPE